MQLGCLAKDLAGRVSAEDSRHLSLSRYFAKSMADAPTEARWDKLYTGTWGVMGNNSYGNCVICTPAHTIMGMQAAESGIQTPISDADVISLSRKMGAMNGYNILDRLKYWKATGMWGHRIWAYGSVDIRDTEAVRKAINTLGMLDIGVNLPDAWRGADVWGVGPGRKYSPGSWGRHSVPFLGYDSNYLYAISWGEVIPMTWEALQKYVDECYSVISPDFLAKDGVTPSGFDLIKMREDMTAITAA
jgi:hypothetical protein